MSSARRSGNGVNKATRRLDEQAAFMMIEAMVAMLILLVGMLATFMLINDANASMGQTRAREAATNLGRELLESAHDTPYAQVGQVGWFQQALQNISGGSAVTSSSGGAYRTTVVRRGMSYVVDVAWCSLDDPGDGYGDHAPGVVWC